MASAASWRRRIGIKAKENNGVKYRMAWRNGSVMKIWRKQQNGSGGMA